MVVSEHGSKIGWYIIVYNLYQNFMHDGYGSGPNDHGSVTARRGHSSVTAGSQLNHSIFSMITAQSRLGHSSITAQVRAGCDHFGHRELTVNSLWAHGEQSRWPIFFSWVLLLIILIARFCNFDNLSHSNPQEVIANCKWDMIKDEYISFKAENGK